MNRSIQAGIEKLEELFSSNKDITVRVGYLREILTAMLTEEKDEYVTRNYVDRDTKLQHQKIEKFCKDMDTVCQKVWKIEDRLARLEEAYKNFIKSCKFCEDYQERPDYCACGEQKVDGKCPAYEEDDDFLVGKPVTSDDFPECKRPALECAHEYSDWSKKCIKCDEPKPLPSSELVKCKHCYDTYGECIKCGRMDSQSDTISIDRRVAEKWRKIEKGLEHAFLQKEIDRALSL
jgi:hypothetical protein